MTNRRETFVVKLDRRSVTKPSCKLHLGQWASSVWSCFRTAFGSKVYAVFLFLHTTGALCHGARKRCYVLAHFAHRKECVSSVDLRVWLLLTFVFLLFGKGV